MLGVKSRYVYIHFDNLNLLVACAGFQRRGRLFSWSESLDSSMIGERDLSRMDMSSRRLCAVYNFYAASISTIQQNRGIRRFTSCLNCALFQLIVNLGFISVIFRAPHILTAHYWIVRKLLQGGFCISAHESVTYGRLTRFHRSISPGDVFQFFYSFNWTISFSSICKTAVSIALFQLLSKERWAVCVVLLPFCSFRMSIMSLISAQFASWDICIVWAPAVWSGQSIVIAVIIFFKGLTKD